jgi:hypothetical protein
MLEGSRRAPGTKTKRAYDPPQCRCATPSHLLFMLPTTDEKTFSIRQVLTCERALGAILLHNPAQFTGLVVR